ncbi:ArnT family glycosyltransferase [Nonomuraea guangzhouensis]|uniref:ArnT family glycosyltransferase n=1 Tax=Nonomuraea guangzhouensis TaxID=1291555 RepID=A0ABW4GB94_9ACTN|nr:glycosyltransferase family 39 protein [Nonomuraea guangzhouensis]
MDTVATVAPRRVTASSNVAVIGLSVVSAAVLALFLAFSGGPGYYVDELYFRVAGEHLAWGYVDQPLLVPLLARLQIALFGDSLTAIRVVPALLTAVAVLVTGLIARELGAGRRLQVLTACVCAATLATLAAGHVLHPTAVDHVVWVTACWLVIRILRTGDERLWLAVGAVVGVGLLAKYLVVLLVVALAAGLLIAGPRRVLKSGRLLAGAGVGVLIAAPGLVWQAVHGWPQFTMAGEMSAGPEGAVNFLVGQVLMIGPFLTPVWVIGLVALLRRAEWRPYRLVAVAYLVMAPALMLLGAEPRYTEGLLTVLLAAGCVRAATLARRLWLGGAALLNGVLAALMVLPVLPIATYAGDPVLATLGEEQFGQTGWPSLAAQVAAVHRALPEDERRWAVVYAQNYGEAGALARYGGAYGLPVAYSGQNSYADFGRPADGVDVVVAVGVERASFSALFRQCEVRGRLTFDVPHFEEGKELLVCRGPREPWPVMWERLRWTGTF